MAHEDGVRWNARYLGSAPDFGAHPLAVRGLGLALPDGPVLELACGRSGSALLAAAAGRRVVAVDVSDVALRQLAAEAGRRGLGDLVTPVQADVTTWRAPAARFACVVCTGYWERPAFLAAAAAVAPGGLLAWEALTAAARSLRPSLPAAWCLGPGEPAALLPASFAVLEQEDLPGHGGLPRRRMLARNSAVAAQAASCE
jgi:SAM-dependent methyltransferase